MRIYLPPARQLIWRLVLWVEMTVLVSLAFFATGIIPQKSIAMLLNAGRLRLGSSVPVPAPIAAPTVLHEPIVQRNSPTRIQIASLGISSLIVFPETADAEMLKKALNQGVVHYPYSAKPSDAHGNVFLFGHSSWRKEEKNPARTVFTKLNELQEGQEIEILYQGEAYRYRVQQVKVLKPEETEVYFDAPGRMLTLSTCWPIGDPTNRFVVQAVFVEKYLWQGIGFGIDTSS